MTQESPLKGEGDRFLIASIQSGDRDAFRQLVDKFAGRLGAYAARRLSGTGLDAEDAVQETFLGLLQGIGRLAQVRSLEAYLFRILRKGHVREGTRLDGDEGLDPLLYPQRGRV